MKYLLTIAVFLLSTSLFCQTTLLLKDGKRVHGELINKRIDGAFVLKVNGENKLYEAKDIEENINSSEDTSEKLTVKDFKVKYRDGRAVEYFVHDGISVTMAFATDNLYGKYYVAQIVVENFTGSSFNLNPNEIVVQLITTEHKKEFLYVYPAEEYLQKVYKKQRTSAFFYAWGQNLAASGAGYSTSVSTSNTNTNLNTATVNVGYYGNNYGVALTSANTRSSASNTIISQTYNGSATYAAQQNANNNTQSYKEQQFHIRQEINGGYLKLNTIENEERIVGQVNIQFKKGEHIKVLVPINGEYYEFNWTGTE